MKKEYLEPSFEVLLFEDDDLILTLSGLDGSEDDFWGDIESEGDNDVNIEDIW